SGLGPELQEALAAVRSVTPAPGRVHCVVGAEGNRPGACAERLTLAAAAEALADRVTLTTDNPRTEPPDAIFDDLLAGVRPPPPRAAAGPGAPPPGGGGPARRAGAARAPPSPPRPPPPPPAPPPPPPAGPPGPAPARGGRPEPSRGQTRTCLTRRLRSPT